MVSEKTIFDKVLAEHLELRRMIQELGGFLEMPQPEITDDEAHIWAGELAERLVKLHHKLFLHFREETRAGVLEKLAERFPWALRTIHTLQEEHGQILGEIRTIVASTMVYAEDRLPTELDVCGRTAKLVEQITRHEEAETDLIQRLHYEDLGGE